jgi:hypothetical protein
MTEKHPIYYHYGYKMIHPLGKPDEKWNYSIQMHKNQNGKHFDLRLHRPGEDKAYSWAMKKIPLSPGIRPALAMRTHDHNLEHMEFEGPLTTAKGYGEVKMVSKGQAEIKKIDEHGIVMNIEGTDFRLRPFRGRRYMFEQIR